MIIISCGCGSRCRGKRDVEEPMSSFVAEIVARRHHDTRMKMEKYEEDEVVHGQKQEAEQAQENEEDEQMKKKELKTQHYQTKKNSLKNQKRNIRQEM